MLAILKAIIQGIRQWIPLLSLKYIFGTCTFSNVIQDFCIFFYFFKKFCLYWVVLLFRANFQSVDKHSLSEWFMERNISCYFHLFIRKLLKESSPCNCIAEKKKKNPYFLVIKLLESTCKISFIRKFCLLESYVKKKA